MSRIKVLDPQTANAIKAGEVIERPVSVAKELIDNAIDAAATIIRIDFEGGGISLLRVSDNGIGMDREDAVKSFTVHATSKINTIEDIYDLSTQGFRGEALASIAACSTVKLITRQADSNTGYEVNISEGVLTYQGECSADIGTVVEVSCLFKNIPARYKFLKKDSTEGMYICSLVEKLAVVNPQISFRLFKDGKQILNTPGSGDMLDAIYAVFGKDIASSMLPLEYEFGAYKLKGYTGKTDCVRGNRSMQYVYVNDRAIKNQSVTAAIDEAYRNAVMKNKFPICFLCIYAAPGMVDVNVHPQKSEVRFTADSDVFRLVFHGIRNAVFTGNDADHKFEGLKEIDVPFESVKPTDSIQSESKKFQVHSAADKYKPMQSQLYYDVPVSNNPVINKPDVSQTKASLSMLEILSGIKETDKTEEVEETVVDEAPLIITDDSKVKSDIDELLSAKISGFLFTTYIILQSYDSVFFVDQHAAHERVLYEKVLNKTVNKENAEAAGNIGSIETLLVPQILDLNSSDFVFVSDNLEAFNKCGFEIELLSGRQIAIRTVPMLGKNKKAGEMFNSILIDLKKENPAKNSVWYNLIQTTACKAAIKAHDRITEEEAYALIDQLSKVDDPYHCAHGRPTFIKVTQTEFEKNFKRIV